MTGVYDQPLGPVRQLIEQGIPFNRLVGIRVDRLDPEGVVMRVPWRDELVGDPMRPTVHGGVISMLADTTGGAACFAALRSVEDRVSTVDLRVDYLRPSHGQDIVCEARVVRLGNKVAVVRMEVYAGEDRQRPIATGHGVYNVLRRTDT